MLVIIIERSMKMVVFPSIGVFKFVQQLIVPEILVKIINDDPLVDHKNMVEVV